MQFRRVHTEDLSVRVVLKNRAKAAQNGPIKITLSVRTGPKAEWQEVKVWKDIDSVAGGATITKNALSEDSDLLHNSASNADFAAKITVECQGCEPETKILLNDGYQKI
jgi:hypothetical protein